MSVVAGIESGLVERAVLFPACCEVCMGTQGPFWDTGVDRPIGPAGRGGDCHVYICRACVKRANVAIGYVKGPQMEKLNEASDRLADAEKERDESQERMTKIAEELTIKQQELLMSNAKVEHLRDLRHQERFRLNQIVALGNELLIGAKD